MSFGDAARQDVTAGGSIAADFSLRDGRMVSGLVSDPTTGPVTGVRVRFDDDLNEVEHAVVRRTNNVGEYRVWLRPAPYTLRVRGQTATVDLSTADKTQNFAAAVGEVKMILRDGGGNPVSQAKAHLHLRDTLDTNAGRTTIISKESSNSDGTVSLYSLDGHAVTDTTKALLEIKIDNGTTIGSTIYNDRRRLHSGAGAVPSGDPIAVTVGSPTDLGTITLPAGGVLSGIVTVAGSPQGNVKIQVRNGGRGGSARFVSTSTQADGTYSLSLPAGTYTRICAITGPDSSTCPNTLSPPTSGPGYHLVDNLTITASDSKTQNFTIP